MMKTHFSRWSRILLSAAAVCAIYSSSLAAGDPLRDGFAAPPDSAKPQTWWHWMNGNISKPGITADLEAMKQIGLGGATIVNVDCNIPEGPVPFMSPQWREDFKFAVSEADRLGLKLCVENCAGWSSSGGPWNTPANGMQRLTSSQTQINGPVAFDDVLKMPPVKLKTYHDIAVLAYKAPKVDVPATAPSAAEGKLEILKAVFEATSGAGSADVKTKLEAAIKSGKKSISATVGEFGDPALGIIKRLRVDFTLDGKPGTISVDENDTLIIPTSAAQLAKALSRHKSSVDHTYVQPPHATDATSGDPIAHEDVLDLTSRMTEDGHLKWDAPPGNWVVLRLGYTPIGIENHPSPKSGLGLECDKMSKAALDAHWDGFMQKVLDDIGPMAGRALDSSLIDSYEVGDQDWTPGFREEFEKRRGYDPLKYLPTFIHQLVDSSEISERFLWDLRRTYADLFAENYYMHFNELCHQHGLNSAVEPYTGPFESLQCGKPADIVMGEFWTGSNGHASVKMCASIAHIYGKTFVGAESFTADENAGKWQSDPYSLKALGDLMYCQGLNRYIFHRYAMQPWNNRFPGMTMGPWGFHFERTETWWKQGKAWIDYISHCQYLLQQGRAVADVAYYTGESAPVEMRVGHPAMPAGYDYDAVNSDVLLHGAMVENGRIKLTSGASYAVLVLPPDDVNMTPAMAECVSKLVNDGATVVGAKPIHAPGLTDYPACDAKVSEVASALWGNVDGKTVTENSVGKGRVVQGESLGDVLKSQKLEPDFESKGTGESNFAYVHRVADDADIYFVSNQKQQFVSAQCTFRVNGKMPELWHPDTGMIEPAPVWNEQNGRTTVQLDFDPAGSVFVIFRQPENQSDHVANITAAQAPASHQLQIQHAVYIAPDGSGEADATSILAGLIREGQLAVVVNNKALGHDPAIMHKKELRVDFELDGKPDHVTVAEDQTLTIPLASAFGTPASCEATVADDGSTSIRMWNNGKVELKTTRGTALQATAQNLPAPQELTGQWKLSFPPNWGAPDSVTLDKLISWTDHTDNGVRYFSGTATYEKDLELSDDRLSHGREVWLDLGTVKNLAEVSLNGQDLGVLWKPPFRVNLTSAVKPGTNKLVIKITNLWPNRLIGDEQLPPDREWDGNQLKAWPQWLLDGKPSPTGRFTFTTWHHWKKDSKPLESGLIGPVTLRSCDVITPK